MCASCLKLARSFRDQDLLAARRSPGSAHHGAESHLPIVPNLRAVLSCPVLSIARSGCQVLSVALAVHLRISHTMMAQARRVHSLIELLSCAARCWAQTE